MKAVRSIYKLMAVFMLSHVSPKAMAQSPVEIPKPFQLPQLFFEPTFYLWVLVIAIVLAALFTMSRALNTLTMLLDEKKSDSEMTEQLREYKVKETAWTKLLQSLTRSVPLEKEEDVLLHHDYDGIRELDNQLPPWWKWGFYLTIVFAVVYLFSYHLSGTGKLQVAEYQEQVAIAELQRIEREKNNANFVTVANVIALNDVAFLAEGKSIFEKNCAACHKADGGGNVGPNLTDDYWIHGGGIKNVFKVVTEGVPAKGMISWKSQFSPRQIQQVSSYILTLRGTAPSGAKEPQGDIWLDTAPKSDSSKVATGDTLVAVVL